MTPRAPHLPDPRRLLAFLVLISLVLRSGAGFPSSTPCLDRMALAPAGDRPTFATELECELWEGIVLLEGDVRTATIAIETCEGELALWKQAAPPLVAPASTSGTGGLRWLEITLALAGGIVVGALILDLVR